MKAVDTSILLFSEQRTDPRHEKARALLTSLAEGPAPWAIPWPCVYEFLRLSTHARVFHPPLPLATAKADLAALLASPTLVLLGETERHPAIFQAILRESGVTGNLVAGLHVAALCREHGVSELFSADIDLQRFVGLKLTNPFE